MPRTISSGQPAAGGASSNVEIQDGGAAGATVFDYTNSNPLATQLVDTNGDPVSVGGGTQYTQGTATTDTDVLTMAGAVRRDTAAVATGVNDGDRLVLSTDSAGRLRATSADTTQPISAASASIASGAVASGAYASGALASGAIASGAIASGAIASGAIAAGAIAAGATSIAENEDVASANADRGVKILFKRLDTPANSSDTDGDYEQPQMSAGRVWASATVTSSALPSGAATSAKQDSEIALLTTIDADTSTIAGAVSGTEMQVDVLTLPALPAGNNNIGDVDVASVTGNVTVVQGTSTNLKADITIAAAQTLATVTTVGTVTTVSTLTGGGVANAAADSGNPVKVGGTAVKNPATATMLADGNRGNLNLDLDNALRVKGWTSGADLLSTRQSVTDTTSTAATNFGAVASTKNFITSVTIYNSSATVSTGVNLQDGNGGTAFWTFPAPSTGGTTHNFDPPLKQPTAATELYFAAIASATTIYVSINGFQSKAY